MAMNQPGISSFFTLLVLLAVVVFADAAPMANSRSTLAVSAQPRKLFARWRSYPDGPHCLKFYSGNPDRARGGYTCLDVEQSRGNWQSADAQLWTCYRNMQAQQVSFKHNRDAGPQGEAYISIVAHDLKYCLDVPGGNAYSGQIVQWWQCNDSQAQRWVMWYYGLSTYISPEGHVGTLCLDAMGGFPKRGNGQRVGLYHCHYGPEQQIKYFNWDARGLCGNGP